MEPPTAQDGYGPGNRLRVLADELAKVERRRLQILDDRDQAVLQMRADGASWAQVAQAAGVSHPALLQRLRRLGLVQRPHRRSPDPAPSPDRT